MAIAKPPKSDDEKREDEVLRRMLNTPHKPHKKGKKSPAKPSKRNASKR